MNRTLLDLSILQAAGTEALRAEARRLAMSGEDEDLRRALVLLTLGEDRDEQEASRLLQAYLARVQHDPVEGRGEAWLAWFLLREIDVRRRINGVLSTITEQRDRLQQQMNELLAIEEAIRQRSLRGENGLEP